VKLAPKISGSIVTPSTQSLEVSPFTQTRPLPSEGESPRAQRDWVRVYNLLMATKGAWWKAALWGWVVVVLVGCNGEIQAIETTNPTSIPPVETITPTVRPTITPVSTWTPVTPLPVPPTLSPMEVSETIIELYESNGGCSLPCFWGWTPGQTSWIDVRHFLLSIPTSYYSGDFNKEGEYTFQFIVPDEISPSNIFQISIRVEDSVVIGISNSVKTGKYPIHEMLRDHGHPDEVWIRTYPQITPGGDIPFVITLIYTDKGIYAGYVVDGQVDRDKIVACPGEGIDPTLGLWRGKERLTFESIGDFRLGLGGYDGSQMPLEEAVGISITEFFNAYRDNISDACLESPRSLWSFSNP